MKLFALTVTGLGLLIKMLCYYYIPKGYTSINRRQVHGALTGHPPTHFSHKDYCRFRNVLVQAPFKPEYIEKKTGKAGFPHRAYFTLDMIRDLPYRTLQQIATYLEVDALLPRTKLIYSVRNALKDL